jgi:hypothetical protein
MIVCGIKWKCEGPLQVTDPERATINANRQGAALVAYSNVFHKKTRAKAYDNCKS